MGKKLTVTFKGHKRELWRAWIREAPIEHATVNGNSVFGKPLEVLTVVHRFRDHCLDEAGWVAPSKRCQGWPESPEPSSCNAKATRTLYYIAPHLRGSWQAANRPSIKSWGTRHRMCADCCSSYRNACREERRARKV